MPGFPLAVGGPSRNVNGTPESFLELMDSENVPSSSHFFTIDPSRETGSRSPGETGTLIGRGILEAGTLLGRRNS